MSEDKNLIAELLKIFAPNGVRPDDYTVWSKGSLTHVELPCGTPSSAKLTFLLAENDVHLIPAGTNNFSFDEDITVGEGKTFVIYSGITFQVAAALDLGLLGMLRLEKETQIEISGKTSGTLGINGVITYTGEEDLIIKSVEPRFYRFSVQAGEKALRAAGMAGIVSSGYGTFYTLTSSSAVITFTGGRIADDIQLRAATQ
jgi:hypothetical protein